MFATIVISLLLLFITSCLTVAKVVSVSLKQRLWLKMYFYIAALIWGLSFIATLLFYSNSLFDSRFSSFIIFLLFALCNALFMLYIRLVVEDNGWFLTLLIPTGYLFFLNVLILNEPSYQGAMDGFAALSKFALVELIVLSYPTFIFAFSMTKCQSWIKGVAMLLFATITGFMGIQQSIGYEGFIADGTGASFVFIIMVLGAIGTYYLAIDKRVKKLFVPNGS